MGVSKTVMESLKSSSDIMNKVNGEMNISDISNMIKTFQKESMKAEMNSEMINDAMDMGDANEDADDVYEQILGEIGMEMNQGA